MFPWYIHVVARISMSFLLWLNVTLFNIYSPFCLLIHPLVKIWIVSTFCLLRVMLLWTLIYKFFIWIYILNPLGYIPGSGVEWYDSYTFNFLITAKLFPRAATTFYIHPVMCMRFQFFHILVNTCYCLFHYSHHSRCEFNLVIVLNCISLMTNEDEHLFIFLLAIYICSLQKPLFKSSAHL